MKEEEGLATDVTGGDFEDLNENQTLVHLLSADHTYQVHFVSKLVNWCFDTQSTSDKEPVWLYQGKRLFAGNDFFQALSTTKKRMMSRYLTVYSFWFVCVASSILKILFSDKCH